jgi:iron complex outermembrane receptor protein
MTGKIVEIQVPNPAYPSYEVNYSRNLDAVSFYGFELAPELFVNEYVSGGLAFSLNEYVLNHSQDDEVESIPYYPELTLNAYAVITPIPHAPESLPWLLSFSIIPRIEYIGERHTDSAGEETLPGYFLAHLKISAGITKYVTLSLGVENMLDSYYEIRYDSPMAGRTYNITLTARY